MRMNKNTNYSVPPFGALAKVPSWTADGGYPGTVVTSDLLVLANAGTGKTVTAAVGWTTTFSHGTVYAQLYKNGAAFGTELYQSGLSGTFSFSHTGQSVAASDTWGVYVRDPAGLSMIVQAASTYIKVE